MNISDLPDRQWIEKEYLPTLDGRVLYVGVDFYTAHYPSLATKASEFVFLDAGDSVLLHGGPTGIRADFFDHLPERPYDHISLYGLVGHGTPVERMPEQIAHADRMLSPGGTLMLGPDKFPRREAFPEEVWSPVNDEARAKIPAFSAPQASHWRDLFSRAPLDRYKVLVEDAELPRVECNYIWWGRKPADHGK